MPTLLPPTWTDRRTPVLLTKAKAADQITWVPALRKDIQASAGRDGDKQKLQEHTKTVRPRSLCGNEGLKLWSAVHLQNRARLSGEAAGRLFAVPRPLGFNIQSVSLITH